MKKNLLINCILATVILASCNKNDQIQTAPDNYPSIEDFFARNGVQIQTRIIDGTLGGSFTSQQGTVVTIPANAFITLGGIAVTGKVTIQFKDIYKKSDMLLSDMPTSASGGFPLKSGGEFFIKAISNNSPLVLAHGKKILVAQPAALTGGLDSVNILKPFIALQDTTGRGTNPPSSWDEATYDSVQYIANQYVFSLYYFNDHIDSGTWCNSDCSSYFDSYPQTILTLQPADDPSVYYTQVFLVFKSVNSMVHVYLGTANFPYYYAPEGLQCTLVAIGVKDNAVYSSFVPITIGSNQTVNFSLAKTTTSAFVSQLRTLN